MTDAKPLHVQVAEKLGWEWATFAGRSMLLPPGRYDAVAFPGSSWRRGCTGEIAGSDYEDIGAWGSAAVVFGRDWNWPPPPRYDINWSVTGPLFEALNLSASPQSEPIPAGGVANWIGWRVFRLPKRLGDPCYEAVGIGPDPHLLLKVICDLLLALPDEVVRKG